MPFFESFWVEVRLRCLDAKEREAFFEMLEYERKRSKKKRAKRHTHTRGRNEEGVKRVE